MASVIESKSLSSSPPTGRCSIQDTYSSGCLRSCQGADISQLNPNKLVELYGSFAFGLDCRMHEWWKTAWENEILNGDNDGMARNQFSDTDLSEWACFAI